jgi:hypothetical protein
MKFPADDPNDIGKNDSVPEEPTAAKPEPTNTAPANPPINNDSVPEQVGAVKPEPTNPAPANPFDPMNLGISTDYAAAINVQKSTKAEGRKPNDQEYFRVSPLAEHRLIVASIADKQDTGKIYIVAGSVLEAVKAEFPRFVRAVQIVIAQTQVGLILAWPVPLEQDRGGRWHSEHRRAAEDGKTKWTTMVSNTPRAKYDVTSVDNPKPVQVDWKSLPPFAEILQQAFSERLIDSVEHPLLMKLRGKIE